MAVANPIPQNIKRIRTSRGLSQADVAQAASLSRQAFGSIETGQAEPRVSSLQRIARALDVALPELLAGPPHLSGVRFRSSKPRGRKAQAIRDQVVFDVARWLKNFNALEESLDQRKPYAMQGVADRLAAVSASNRPVEAARVTRKALGLRKDEPIRDICGLLESAGVKVQVQKLPIEDLFGLSVAPGDGGPAVVVNVRKDISVERRIFTVAHELGHLLLHPHAYDVRELAEDHDEEKEADLFAAHFLMPTELFQSEWGDPSGLPFVDRVLHVKRIFRVSYMTVLYRLVELGQADPGKVWMDFRFRCKQRYGISLTKKVEPEPLVEAERKLEPKHLDDLDFVEDRLSRLVRKAIESDAITLSRGAELLGVDLSTMRDVVASWEVAA